MDAYPKVIQVGALTVTVLDADDEARWLSAPPPAAAPVPEPEPEPVQEPEPEPAKTAPRKKRAAIVPKKPRQPKKK